MDVPKKFKDDWWVVNSMIMFDDTAIGTAVISLGLLSRDGVVVLVGIAIGVTGLVVAGMAVGGLVVAPIAWLSA